MPTVDSAWVIGPYDLRVLPVGLQAESVKSFGMWVADSPCNCRPGVEPPPPHTTVTSWFEVENDSRRRTYSAVACLSCQPFCYKDAALMQQFTAFFFFWEWRKSAPHSGWCSCWDSVHVEFPCHALISHKSCLFVNGFDFEGITTNRLLLRLYFSAPWRATGRHWKSSLVPHWIFYLLWHLWLRVVYASKKSWKKQKTHTLLHIYLFSYTLSCQFLRYTWLKLKLSNTTAQNKSFLHDDCTAQFCRDCFKVLFQLYGHIWK